MALTTNAVVFDEDITWFKACLADQQLIEKLQAIRLIVTDVDGCLTPGTVAFSEDASRNKSFCIQDGYGTTQALKAGLIIAIISGRKSTATATRCRELGIDEQRCLTGLSTGKREALRSLIDQHSLATNQTLYFGDDLLDLEVIDHVGLFVCPANGLFYVRNAAHLTVPRPGGSGSFRLLLDLIMYAQQIHPAQKALAAALQ